MFNRSERGLIKNSLLKNNNLMYTKMLESKSMMDGQDLSFEESCTKIIENILKLF